MHTSFTPIGHLMHVTYKSTHIHTHTQIEAKEAAEVYEQFVASFEGSGKAGKTFVRGSTTIDPGTGST